MYPNFILIYNTRDTQRSYYLNTRVVIMCTEKIFSVQQDIKGALHPFILAPLQGYHDTGLQGYHDTGVSLKCQYFELLSLITKLGMFSCY